MKKILDLPSCDDCPFYEWVDISEKKGFCDKMLDGSLKLIGRESPPPECPLPNLEESACTAEQQKSESLLCPKCHNKREGDMKKVEGDDIWRCLVCGWHWKK